MIRINLCPIDELESQYWYLPDLAFLIVVGFAGWFGVQYYLGTIQDQIDEVDQQRHSLEDSTAKLTPELDHIKSLEKDELDLNDKLVALKSITVSKISKYRPVIVLEHLQNLKPDGTWFESLCIDDCSGHDFQIVGQARDNILTAELMTAIRSTGSQELDEADLRTQVYFTELNLEDTRIKGHGGDCGHAAGGPGGGAPAGGRFGELSRCPEFTIDGKIAERAVADKAPGGNAPPASPPKPNGNDDAPAAATPPDAPPAPPAPVSEAEPERPASPTMRF